MKTLLQLESFTLFIAGIVLCYLQPIALPWYLWLLCFFLPDIGMLGYLAGNKTGAISYNLFHHMGIAIALLLAGYFYQADWAFLSGSLLLAHSCFDRVMGYGLKYSQGFSYTHLGRIGKAKQEAKK